MARRRKSSGWPRLDQWLDHPIKSYKRAARKIDVNRAAWLKEKNKIKADRAKAKQDRNTEQAKSRAATAARRAGKEKAKRDRLAAAEARTQQIAAKPQVVRARVTASPATPPQRRPAAMRSAPAAPASSQQPAAACGARTEDGSPCQNTTLGGPCAAGHRPKGARGQVSVTISGTGRFGPGGSVGTVIGNPGETRRPPKRDRDGLGRPLDPESREFFRLRDEEGYKGPIRWDKGEMPYKVDQGGNRIA